MPRPRTQGQAKWAPEEWDSNLILRARKAWRSGASIEEVRTIVQSRVSVERFRQIAAKHGMKWGRGGNHTGDSALMTKPMERL